MDFVNTLFTYVFEVMKWGGGIVAMVGVIRWVMHGQSRDAGEQTNDMWILAAGGVLAAVGVIAGQYLQFPTL